MESSSEKLDKSDESAEPNNSVEKVDTGTIKNIVQPEFRPEEELKNNTNTDANSSNNEINEDIDLNDIVLITESLPPVIEDSVENTKSTEPNITNKNECENVNIDSIQLIEATESEMQSEKCDNEPIDIDEILNSLNVDFDTPSSSEVQNACEASSSIVSENPPESLCVEKEGKAEDVVLLSDDEEVVEVGKLKRFFPAKMIN